MFSPLNLEEIKKIVRFLTNIKFSSLESSKGVPLGEPARKNEFFNSRPDDPVGRAGGESPTEGRGEVVDLSLHSPSLIQFGSIELVSGLLLIVSG